MKFDCQEIRFVACAGWFEVWQPQPVYRSVAELSRVSPSRSSSLTMNYTGRLTKKIFVPQSLGMRSFYTLTSLRERLGNECRLMTSVLQCLSLSSWLWPAWPSPSPGTKEVSHNPHGQESGLILLFQLVCLTVPLASVLPLPRCLPSSAAVTPPCSSITATPPSVPRASPATLLPPRLERETLAGLPRRRRDTSELSHHHYQY